jgi:RHS repeat-associated protein
MTFSATCATGEVLRSRSYYRAEQYDSDLGLYYLRARYYNPLTGRFLSRDPEDGVITDPASLHKYMYAGGDPVNRVDPRGRADEEEEVGIIPSIIRATVTVATNLWGTLPEYLATVEQFAGNIYLTVQDVLEAIAANRYAASAARFLACGITGSLGIRKQSLRRQEEVGYRRIPISLQRLCHHSMGKSSPLGPAIRRGRF